MPKTTTLKKIACVLAISLFLLSIMAGCQSGTKTFFTADDNGESINLKLNETIKIKLESNPTTGYSWNLSNQSDTAIISLISSDFETSTTDKDIAGAGGYDTITFKAIGEGNTTIILTYNRTWEEDVEPAETFKLNVSVK